VLKLNNATQKYADFIAAVTRKEKAVYRLASTTRYAWPDPLWNLSRGKIFNWAGTKFSVAVST
jgi:hypothetical protein